MSQNPSASDAKMMTWSVWVSIQCGTGQEVLGSALAEARVELHRDVDDGGDEAEQEDGDLALPAGELAPTMSATPAATSPQGWGSGARPIA